MKRIIAFFTTLFILIIITLLYSEPSFNDNDPGCSGGGCHSFKAGLVNITEQGELQIGRTGPRGAHRQVRQLADG